MKDIVPKNNQVQCYFNGQTLELQVCKECEHYYFDGAVAALGEFTFTYDTSLDVQSPHVCTLK